MRSDDWSTYAGFSIGRVREPRFVISIDVPETLVLTSRLGISNLVGIAIEGVIENIGAISQQVQPLDGVSTIGSVSFDLIDRGNSDEFGRPLTVYEGGVESLLEVGSSSQVVAFEAWPNTSGGNLTYEINRAITNYGLSGKKVQIYAGFTDDFRDYVLVSTSFIDRAEYKDGVYTFSCRDVKKQMRSDVFEQKTFRLAADLTDGTESPDSSAADISVYSTDGAVMMTHTASFSDSPSATVGYLRVVDTGEIIRYTGFSDSPAQFTGITRGVFNTPIQATDGDYTVPFEEWPELEEFIYLEMPAPQLAYAVMTGNVPGYSITLPAHWHAGMSTDDIDLTQFENIGDDLWDELDGVVLYFTHLKKTDAKKFIEEEIFRLVGLFSPVGIDGRLGLGLVNKALATSSYDIGLSDGSITSHSALKYKESDVVNRYQIDFQWNGQKFLRSFVFVDSDSVARHDASKVKTLRFKGLHNSRHSQALIAQLINVLQDRYRNPPQEITVDLMPPYDVIEANDIVKINLPNLIDYNTQAGLDRTFEVQRTSIDYIRGRTSLSLFASTGAEGEPMYQPTASQVLEDGFYSSKGTAANTVLTMSGNTVTANGTLAGNANMNNAGAVYYHLGDMTIQAGVTVTVQENVQLRVMGTLTINGTLDGIGEGKAGATDPHTAGAAPSSTGGANLRTNSYSVAGTAGYIGRTGASDGVIRDDTSIFGIPFRGFYNVPGRSVSGQHSQFPSIAIQYSQASPVDDDIAGIPNDLRGTSGSSGAPLYHLDDNIILAKGGDGGDSGSGLVLIVRNLVFGSSGRIDLSGGDGEQGDTSTGLYSGKTIAAGTGAGGGPGALLVLLDGDATFPQVLPNFIARTGNTDVQAGVNSGGSQSVAFDIGNNRISWDSNYVEPWAGRNRGWNDGEPISIIDDVDFSQGAYKVLYIPEPD